MQLPNIASRAIASTMVMIPMYIPLLGAPQSWDPIFASIGCNVSGKLFVPTELSLWNNSNRDLAKFQTADRPIPIDHQSCLRSRTECNDSSNSRLYQSHCQTPFLSQHQVTSLRPHDLGCTSYCRCTSGNLQICRLVRSRWTGHPHGRNLLRRSAC